MFEIIIITTYLVDNNIMHTILYKSIIFFDSSLKAIVIWKNWRTFDSQSYFLNSFIILKNKLMKKIKEN
jgi:hypothetical protein